MENLQGGTLSLEHRYQVDTREDRVGFITRYRGRQLPFERPVWIGVYDRLPDAGADTRVFDRIKTSAHRAHRVDGPGVSRILDYGEIDRGVPFVVSERIEATTLAEHLDEHGPLPPADVVPLVETVAQGLEQIHAVDLAHGNLTGDWIHLVDGAPEQPRVSYFHVGLTLDELRRMDGAVLTPEIVCAYPPEAFERETLPPEELDEDHDPTATFTPRADIFALGLVVYETLVGFHPFFDDDEPTDASEGIARLQSEQARPLTDFGIESGISDAVSRALAPDPDKRWESPTAFAEALRDAHADLAGPDTADRIDAAADSSPDPAADSAGDSDLSPDLETAAPADEREDLEPGGPASMLVTLAIAAFFASNIGWFFYYMDTRGAGGDETRSAPAAPVESVELRSTPADAAIFIEDGKKLGQTPMRVPDDLLAESPLELVIKKAGFEDHPVTLRRRDTTRGVGVQLEKAN